jgi:hypothetical protein
MKSKIKYIKAYMRDIVVIRGNVPLKQQRGYQLKKSKRQ